MCLLGSDSGSARVTLLRAQQHPWGWGGVTKAAGHPPVLVAPAPLLPRSWKHPCLFLEVVLLPLLVLLVLLVLLFELQTQVC